VMVSFTAPSIGSSSMVQRPGPSALISAMRTELADVLVDPLPCRFGHSKAGSGLDMIFSHDTLWT
jgi:hypothetical protein